MLSPGPAKMEITSLPESFNIMLESLDNVLIQIYSSQHFFSFLLLS